MFPAALEIFFDVLSGYDTDVFFRGFFPGKVTFSVSKNGPNYSRRTLKDGGFFFPNFFIESNTMEIRSFLEKAFFVGECLSTARIRS